MAGDAEIVARLLLASALGAAIGLEREVHGRDAGIRTYLLVSLGSALIMVVSEYLGFKYEGTAPEFFRADPGRIAAQAITGIGFLGAGVIIRYRNSIRGLTTAACMWVVCAIGLAIGSGYYLFGLTVTGITVFSLLGLKGMERKLKRDWYRDLLVVSEEVEGQFELLQAILDKHNVTARSFSISKDRQKKELVVQFKLRFRTTEPFDWQIVRDTYTIAGVKRVELR